MEGAGSRLGRVSSRYGQQPASSSPANFTGPVRRWEKKWVHVSSLHRSRPSSSITRHHHHHQRSHPDKTGPGVLLCKWTPLSHPPASAHDAVDAPLTPPRRKFRYTPIAVLEEKKREVVKMVQNRAKSGEEEERKIGEMSDDDDSFDGLLNINQGPMEAGHQVHNESFSTPRYVNTRLNLEIPLKAQEDSPDPG